MNPETTRPEIDPETIPDEYRDTLDLNLSGAQLMVSYSRLINYLRFLATGNVAEGPPTNDDDKFLLSKITLGDDIVKFLIYLGDYSLTAVKINGQWCYFPDSPCTIRGGTQVVGFTSAYTAPDNASLEVGLAGLVGSVRRLIQGGGGAEAATWREAYLGAVKNISEPARFNRQLIEFMASIQLPRENGLSNGHY